CAREDGSSYGWFAYW
nr:immunoglobulin heavy chain junction region [Mus musculus]MBK4187989.1 immunoglobulin heavy chain junction region [Mus musculus]MBK4187990.1 immunoglobulin heavy chain junction region [Mus musculus]MBK4187991.1 immunoglobulin heavy chain junction region [Mus musculus]MBK4187992.1 immunoglobulin heavy chain junction region [Mus musculus]